jgi:hypothetical protein
MANRSLRLGSWHSREPGKAVRSRTVEIRSKGCNRSTSLATSASLTRIILSLKVVIYSYSEGYA